MAKANWMIIDGNARQIKAGITVDYMRGKYPDKKIDKACCPPSMATMERWVSNGVAKALDGCRVEPDGTCEHGQPSWLIALGWI